MTGGIWTQSDSRAPVLNHEDILRNVVKEGGGEGDL